MGRMIRTKIRRKDRTTTVAMVTIDAIVIVIVDSIWYNIDFLFDPDTGVGADYNVHTVDIYE